MINKFSISLNAYQQRSGKSLKRMNQVVSHLRHKPLGVIAVLGPFNFPAHLPNGHIIPALLAGNAVIFKPSEHTPLVAEKMMKFWQQAGLSPGVLNLLQGDKETAQQIIKQPIDGLFFTGSYATGQFLNKRFAAKPEMMLALEMGGNNP